MKCYIDTEDDRFYFQTVKEAKDYLSDPEWVRRAFDGYEDDFLVSIEWDTDYGEWDDPITIDSWYLREIRLLHGIPLHQTWPYMVLIGREFREFDNYEDYARVARMIEPEHWQKAHGLRTIRKKKRK